MNSIRVWRREVRKILKTNPSLRDFARTDALVEALTDAVDDANGDMHLEQPLTALTLDDPTFSDFEYVMNGEIKP